jgi:hypothetical protein
MNEELRVVSKLTEKELTNGLKLLTSNPSMITLRIIGIVFCLIGIFSIASNYKISGEINLGDNIPIIILGLGFNFYFIILPKIQANKLFKNQSSITETIEFVFDSSGISATGETWNSSTRWFAPKPIKINKDVILIFQSKNSAYIISRKVFKDEDFLKLKRLAGVS